MQRILCIDDDASILGLYKGFLEDEGYEVITSNYIKEGMKVLRQQPVSLVITDILMPDMDGIELIRVLIHDPTSPPIIAVSGGGVHLLGGDLLYMALSFGVQGVLMKPFTENELLCAVKHAVGEFVPETWSQGMAKSPMVSMEHR